MRLFLDEVVKLAGAAAPAEDGSIPEPPEPEDPRVLAAEEATARGDYDDAIGQYAAILAAEPAHARAAAAIREVELLRRVGMAAPDAVEKSDAAPDDVDLAQEAADVLLARGEVSNAFARLLATIRASSGPQREQARLRLVELFNVIGNDDPRVSAARKELTKALADEAVPAVLDPTGIAAGRRRRAGSSAGRRRRARSPAAPARRAAAAGPQGAARRRTPTGRRCRRRGIVPRLACRPRSGRFLPAGTGSRAGRR